MNYFIRGLLDFVFYYLSCLYFVMYFQVHFRMLTVFQIYAYLFLLHLSRIQENCIFLFVFING